MSADHVTMKLAIVAENYELLVTRVTFFDCTVHSSYVDSFDYDIRLRYDNDPTTIRLGRIARAPASIRRDATRAKNEHVDFSS